MNRINVVYVMTILFAAMGMRVLLAADCPEDCPQERATTGVQSCEDTATLCKGQEENVCTGLKAKEVNKDFPQGKEGTESCLVANNFLAQCSREVVCEWNDNAAPPRCEIKDGTGGAWTSKKKWADSACAGAAG